MATKKLRDLHIKTPHGSTEHNCELEDVIERWWYNKLNDDGKVVSTTPEERKRIQERMKHKSALFDRYLDNISKLRFISQARVDKYTSFYKYCTKERACTNDGVEGYAVTELEAALSHSEIMLDNVGVGYMIEHLSHTNPRLECKILCILAALYKDMTRKELQSTMQNMGLSLRRSIKLTRFLIKERI